MNKKKGKKDPPEEDKSDQSMIRDDAFSVGTIDSSLNMKKQGDRGFSDNYNFSQKSKNMPRPQLQTADAFTPVKIAQPLQALPATLIGHRCQIRDQTLGYFLLTDNQCLVEMERKIRQSCAKTIGSSNCTITQAQMTSIIQRLLVICSAIQIAHTLPFRDKKFVHRLTKLGNLEMQVPPLLKSLVNTFGDFQTNKGYSRMIGGAMQCFSLLQHAMFNRLASERQINENQHFKYAFDNMDPLMPGKSVGLIATGVTPAPFDDQLLLFEQLNMHANDQRQQRYRSIKLLGQEEMTIQRLALLGFTGAFSIAAWNFEQLIDQAETSLLTIQDELAYYPGELVLMTYTDQGKACQIVGADGKRVAMIEIPSWNDIKIGYAFRMNKTFVPTYYQDTQIDQQPEDTKFEMMSHEYN